MFSRMKRIVIQYLAIWKGCLLSLRYRLPPGDLKRWKGTVYCVGSGKSLDMVDVAPVQHCVVLLLNGAIAYSERFDSSNTIYWFAQDYKRITEIGPSVPNTTKKILSCQKPDEIPNVEKFLHPGDAFLLPRFRLQKSVNHYRVKCVYPSDTEPLIARRRLRTIKLSPNTVMLTAIRVAAGSGAQRIITLGFDLSQNATQTDYAAGAGPVAGGHAGNFDLSLVSNQLSRILAELSAKGVEIANCSPRTHETILPKINRL